MMINGPQRTRPIGQPLGLTPEQLDMAADVTPFDAVQARVLWLQHAPAVLMALLDAVVENGGADAEQT